MMNKWRRKRVKVYNGMGGRGGVGGGRVSLENLFLTGMQSQQNRFNLKSYPNIT